MTTETLDSNRSNWVAAAVGLLVGVLSLFAAQLLDAALTGRPPGPGASFGHFALAAATFAFAYSPALRALLPTRTERLDIDWPVVHSSTIAFVLFLVPSLVAAPDSTGHRLPYFYAASILIGWVAWQLPLVSKPAAAAHIHLLVGWDRLPYALFVAVALVLLLASAISSAAAQRSASIQLANWAFGFLLLAVLIATFCLLLDRDFSKDRWRSVSHLLVPVAALAFFPLAWFVDGNSSSAAEKQVITDTLPNFLAQQSRPGDILISDIPALRLSSIPQIGSSLSVDPDQRGQALWDDLTRALATHRRVLWITVPEQSHDTLGTLATFLKANGCLDSISDSSLPVRVYELNRPFVPPSVLSPFWAARTANAFDPVLVNFGPILMTGIRYERRACSHDSVAVAIQWHIPARTSSLLKLSLFLTDARGRRVQTQDFYIDDPSQRHTDQWQPGASTAAYYLLTIPLGTPPGRYKLGVGVYRVSQTQWLSIGSSEGVESRMDHVQVGTVQVYRAQDVSADPLNSRQESGLLPSNTLVADGLSLDGYEVANPTIIPGETLHLALRWHSKRDGLPSYTIKVALRQGDKTVAEESAIPVDGTYPTDLWKSGEYVTERRELRVPPDTAGGLARLEVSAVGEQTTYLADISIEPIARTYLMPTIAHSTRAVFSGVGDLAGYDLANTSLAANRQFEVTFYWRAAAPMEKDYTVFAQLLAADGHLVAQSDSRPANGHRPTRNWLPGEIVSDPHSLDFKDPTYQGEAQLIVGLYDAETGERVPVEGGTDDYFLVPIRLQVIK